MSDKLRNEPIATLKVSDDGVALGSTHAGEIWNAKRRLAAANRLRRNPTFVP